ncbi:MAG: cysteine desulfurase NifS [Sedimentisphaerales bacterium]|jgi:cysteine desulfurase|nr:cysteine desulfurase NifS [Sedimentisphaerales bacterium]HNY78552.1 cysteine desulfurase NifS [Sedimentisphaerales bacterium]HOC63790.1 cysteine desulfurase NifS [Sedimentisphaerales bacterium]HOH64534.1 cysteine desulfurase NifS [Sedimentisphaerales bacterium]HPY48944.1 cysteine desulfurase NifS [Sedimentisphaerales bacterium]
MKVIYFDNNATTRVADEVFEAMRPYFCELYGNPSSMHTFGGQVGVRIREAREHVAALLGCHPSEVIFTSCGTESDSTAILGTLAAVPHRRKVITTRVEHPAVLTVCRDLENRGYQVIELGVDKQGRLDLGELESHLDDDTAIVTIMSANNETGTVFPIEKIARMVTDRGITFHTDAVQVVGKIPLNLADSCVNLLSLSGHKLHGPKGVGVLYVRKGTRIAPLLLGGHQEGGRRAGTENVPGIIGLGKACELASRYMEDENTRVRTLRDRLESAILASCPDSRINGDPENRLPNTTNISFEYIEGEAILLMLDRFGICASSGSACTSGSLEPSHVLRAMGVPFTAAHGSIRYSLSRYNTEEEVDFTIDKMPQIIERLRELSPFVGQVTA